MRGSSFELSNASGEPLRGDVYAPAGERRCPVVVVCHGFKGFKDWGFFPELSSRLAASGFLTVPFNFSGSGIGADLQNFTELERFARDTTSKQVADLGCVLDALHAQRLGAGRADLQRVAVLGHSRGAATALIRAHEDARVRAVIAWSGISTLWRYPEAEIAAWKERGFMEFLNARTKQMMRIEYGMVEDLLANRERFDLIRTARALSVPLLIVHGEEDESVPVREAHAIYEAAGTAGDTLQIVPGSGHTFGAVHPWKGSTPALDEAIDATRAWLLELWPDAGEGAEA
jgi:dienelactone hydrolase